ncbi:D-lysergyl-peptide-synthetase subunit 1 [Claviceps pazoutovae]|uniref:D-lysergyl-peptide-synthetase subunit 1 n=1 Tax=Claviceps pazoutovae TaxID=1649127 RepID=A0A9P7M976_9HYPO|nr:D-lysergyl-peptide-synthetase subunit 1 [Claviceps pazoutovae]
MSIPIPEKLQRLTAVKSPFAFNHSFESINGDKNKSERYTASSSAVSTFEIGQPCLLTNFKSAAACSGPAITKVVTVNDKNSGSKLKNVINGKNVSASEVFKGAWAVVLGTYLAKSHVSLDYGVMKFKGLESETPCNARVSSETSEMLTSSFLLRANDTLLDIIRQNSMCARTEFRQKFSLDDVESPKRCNTCVIYWPEISCSKQVQIDAWMTGLEETEQLTQYDCMIHFASDMRCMISYRDQFMSECQARHLAAALRVVLSSIASAPQQSLADVDMCSSLDYQTLSRWNLKAPVVTEVCVHDLITQSCGSRPKSQAVVSWDGCLTYDEMNIFSSHLAQRLRDAGVEPGVFVALCLDRCKWAVIGILAVLKAGGAFCALDPSYPVSRLKEMCRDLEITIVLTVKSNIQQASPLAGKVFALDDDVYSESASSSAHESASRFNVSPHDPVYAVFTSGSTGKPKGIIMEHASFSACALSSMKPLQIADQDRVLHFASYAFDASVIEILVPLIAGATVAIPSERARLEDLPRAMTDLKATWAFLTPTVARLYRPGQMPTLKTLCLGGEAVNASDIRFWSSKNLISGYNPTECCPLGISGPLNDRMPRSLGSTFASQVAWIVDPKDHEKLLPAGAIGELAIEGPVVARGYIHDVTCSDSSTPFVVKPPLWLRRFRATANRGSRIYLTGDLARRDCDDGSVHYLGRKDDQVKIHGQRVELAEIEHHLEQHFVSLAIKVVVMLLRPVSGRMVLAALIMPHQRLENGDKDSKSLLMEPGDVSQDFRAHLASAASKLRLALPSHMVPSVYLPIRHFPTTKSGKIDRGHLQSLIFSLSPEDLHGGEETSRRGEEPKSDREKLLQGLFAQALDLPHNQIDLDSNFFQLGGDSLSAMRLLALALEEGISSIAYQDIFSHPILRQLVPISTSAASRDLLPSATEETAPFSLVNDLDMLIQTAIEQCGSGVGKADIEDIYPCTHLQQILMASTAHNPNAYVAMLSFTLKSGIDRARLERAWHIACSGHAILRTRLVQTDTGDCYQVVVKKPPHWTETNEVGDDCSTSSLSRTSFGLGRPLIQSHLTSNRLFVAMHHALYDGWSLPMLIRELDLAYRELSIRRLPCLKNYVKYTMHSADAAASFWQAEFQDANPVHFPAPSSLDYKPQPCASMTVSVPLVDSPRRNVTLATEIQFAWAMTAYRYTGCKDVIFGLISSGRSAPVAQIESILGPTFACTPLRVSIDPQGKLGEALDDLQYTVVEQSLFVHFGAQAIRQLGPNAAAACNFQTVLAVEADGPDMREVDGSWFTRYDFLSDVASFSSHALTLRCKLSTQGVEVNAVYDEAVVDERQMRRILAQFENILTQIHSNETIHDEIGGLYKLSGSDWRELQAWNSNLPPPHPKLLGAHHAIQEKCQTQPDATAIDAWDGSVTYGELERRAEKLASLVRGHVSKSNQVVVLYFTKSWLTVVAQLAVLKAGAAFITLDISQPPHHLRRIIAALGPALILVLTSEELHRAAEELQVDAAVMAVDKDNLSNATAIASQTSSSACTVECGLMYVVATSGTTGMPKIIMTNHQSFMTNASPLINRMGITAESRVFQFCGYSFDLMIAEHLLTLLAGGCICIPSLHNRDNRFAASIVEFKANWIGAPSSVLQLLDPQTVPTVKTIMQGGERLLQGLVDRWASHARLINAYGPAECSVAALVSDTVRPDTEDVQNLGFATGSVCWIVNADTLKKLLPVPIGAEGELLIEGHTLSRGYLGDVDKTNAVFLGLPDWLRDFRAKRNQGQEHRAYLTGDIVRQNSDGSISFVRRKDAQVKIRGQRVELADVEHQVERCFAGAHQVVTDIVQIPDSQSSILVALVLTKDAMTICKQQESLLDQKSAGGLSILDPTSSFTANANAAKAALQDQMPAYMVPDLFVPVSEFPREASGKVGRKAIKQYLASFVQQDWARYSSTRKVPPSNATEHEIHNIWARVLQIEPHTFGVHDSFFRLGGDSVSSMQVAAACGVAGISVTIKDMFEYRTIRKLALARGETPQGDVATTSAKGDDSGAQQEMAPRAFYPEGRLEIYMERMQSRLGRALERIYPCSPIQQGILMSHARNPRHYDEMIQWRVAGDVSCDISRMRRAWREVVSRHDILRTLFLQVSEDSFLDQVVLKNYSPDISVCADGEDGEANRPFEDSVPMHQLFVFQRSADDVTVSLRIHHALVDGLSLHIIRRDLELAYQGRLHELAEPPAYHEYVSYLQERRLQKSPEEYWKSYLQGATGALFPAVQDEPAQDGKYFGAVEVELGPSAKLTQFCEEHKLGVTVVLHVVWAIIVQRYTATDEVCFGYMTSGRHISVANVENMVGPLFNMLIGRVKLAYHQSLLSTMYAYQESFINSLDHQHQSLVQSLHSIGSSAGDLFNSLITFFNDQPENHASQRQSALRLVGDAVQSRSEYPITLNIVSRADKIKMQLSYHTSLLNSVSANTIAKAFRFVLQRTLEQPHELLRALQVLDEDQMNNVFEKNRSMPPQVEEFIHDTIHQQCLRCPDSPSVCAWDGNFTYRQLDELSSALSEEIVRKGAGPEVTIPIALEKTRWTPVAMLAVLKSGSSFVLMDSTHPAARLGAIIQAIGPPVIIVSAQTRSKAASFSTDMIEVGDWLAREIPVAKQHVTRQSGSVKANHAAYLVFTSGSTGKPKGAIVEHASLSTAAKYMASRLHIDSASRVLQFSSHAWDIPVTEVLVTLRMGGCVCVPSEEERTGNLAKASERMKVNWALWTPTVARLFKPEEFPHLETLVFAGEALSATDLETWCYRVRLIQGYGPAECSLISTVTDPLTRSDNPRCIGLPSGCVAWVVNRDNHELLAPPGAIGELVLEGPIVGRGYLGDPERAASAFTSPPAWLMKLRGSGSSIRLYKTGDLVRQHVSSGLLTFVGRNDDQVKVRGQRVEPGEVEGQVAQVFPGSQVIVLVVKKLAGAVLAALVLQNGEDRSSAGETDNLFPPPSLAFAALAKAAFSKLRETMPTYMIPSIILPLMYLPKAATGKADRNLLRDRVASLSNEEIEAYVAASVSHRPASTAIEAELQQLVGQVLQKPLHSISLDEDLFRLGMDSLTAMTLASAARRRGWEVSVPIIFQHSRISDLARIVEQGQHGISSRSQLEEARAILNKRLVSLLPEICTKWDLPQDQITHIAPTTYYQHMALASDHEAFFGLYFSKPVASEALKAAASRVVNLHSILRTAFVPLENTYVQLTLCDFDLPSQEIQTKETEVSAAMELFCRDAADKTAGFGVPVTKLILMLDRQGDCLSLLLRLQRAQFDGVSVMRIMADWRSALENASCSWEPSPSLDYADFALGRVAQNTPDVFGMWRDVLQGSSMTYLTPQEEYISMTDRAHAERLVTSSCDIPLPEPAPGYTMATVAKAAWAMCLARETESEDVLCLQLVRNRHLALDGIDKMVGCSLNYVPVRVPLRRDWKTSDLLHWLHQQHIRTMAGDTADWPDIVAKSTTWSSDTEFGSVIHYLSAPATPVYHFPGDTVAQFQLYDEKMTHTCPLVTCVEFPGPTEQSGRQMKIMVTSAVGGQDMVDRLLAVFRHLLCEANAQLDQSVSNILQGLRDGDDAMGKAQ